MKLTQPMKLTTPLKIGRTLFVEGHEALPCTGTPHHKKLLFYKKKRATYGQIPYVARLSFFY